jgi:hypothetical protein
MGPSGKSLLKHFVVFAPKTFSISTTCLLWRETFLIILPRAEARGYHIVAPTELLFSKSDFPDTITNKGSLFAKGNGVAYV